MKDFNNRKGKRSGIEGCYIPISKTKAVKIYDKMTIALRTRNRQMRAWKKGFAPRVYKKKITKCLFTWKWKEGHEWEVGQKYGYFYVTEIAPKPCGGYSCEEYDELDKGLMKLGLAEDLHDGNIRRLRNGKLVAIDFGEYST